METKTDIAILQQVPFFKELSADILEEAVSASQERQVEDGSFLFYQDDPADHIYVIKSGRIKLTQLSDDGQQVLMRVATPGMMIAIIAIVPGIVYPVTAQAAEDCQLFSWTNEAMNRLIEHHPQLAFKVMRHLADHVREFQDRYRELATERVERRLARTIIRLASQAGKKTPEGVLLDLPLTRQDLAEMTGTTLYTVSRILSQWESKGLVEAGREKVLIKFPHGLVSIAEDLPRR